MHGATEAEIHNRNSELGAKLREIESRPKRHPILHWGAFALSLLSFVLLVVWQANPRQPVSRNVINLDIALAAVFAIEFFTRSGFRWHPLSYTRTRFFDFIAVVPALALVNHGFYFQPVWVWLILIARGIRFIDRFLGDGFVTRNALALLDGFEEEITDRVLERIIARLQADMDKAGLSHGVAAAFRKNKATILRRIRSAAPNRGIGPELARFVGLEALMERVEEQTFDAVVGIIDSQEIDKAVREAVDSSFQSVLSEVGKKRWLEHIGIKR